MALLICKTCEGNIIPIEGKNLGVCDSCGRMESLPTVTDERRTDAFNRGNHFRKNYEFDKALEEYTQIIKEDPTDAEAHWCMTLSRYGVNFQEDPNTKELIPTIDRISYTSILEDPDYIAALKYADGDRKTFYEESAQRIRAIQQGLLEVSSKEDPFDVFICFKDTNDLTKKRTRDSVLAQELYSELTKRDFKVFFSRITLKEEHMGEEWEPYIFAALNSAKVMLVVGTSRENLDAPWVKNEWSRFQNLRRSDKTKILVPCISGMDPADLPEGLKALEARDMNEISFMQDIIYGIDRVVNGDKKKEKVQQKAATVTADNYVKRAMMAIEDGDNKKAEQLLEQALNLDPEIGDAHLCKLLIERKVRSVDKLSGCAKPLATSTNYNRAIKYCDLATQQKLKAADAAIRQRIRDKEIEDQYIDLREQLSMTTTGDYAAELVKEFEAMGGYKDCAALAQQASELADRLHKKEEEERIAEEERAAKEKAEKERQKELEMEAERKRVKREKRKKTVKKIRRTVFFVILLCIVAFVINQQVVEPYRVIYQEAEEAMAAGDYGTAVLRYYDVADNGIAKLFMGDADEKGLEACTLWLGYEPTVVSSSDYPWLSVDDEGGLQFDPDEYVEEENFTMPTIIDGELVTGFGDYCFEGLSGLQSLNIPANYTWIGVRAFADCDNLTALELGDYTTTIRESAFEDCDSLTAMVMPATMKEIGNYAFSGCEYLVNLTLNQGLEIIGDGAFSNIAANTIVVPGSVESIGMDAFCATPVASITLEEGVGNIGERAFAESFNLTEINIPGSVKTVGVAAFVGCPNLGSVVIGSGVETIGEYAFSGSEALWNLDLGDTVTTIDPYAFEACNALSAVTIPGSVTSIGSGAFTGCDMLNSVTISDNNGLVIGVGAFQYCENLAYVTVGAGTREICEAAFADNSNTVYVSLGEGIETIGPWAFSGCSIQELTLPSTLVTLGQGAFKANDFQGVAIPAGVTVIEADTFGDCDRFYWIWFQDSISIIRDDAFYNNPVFTQVYYSGPAEAWYNVSKGNNDYMNYLQLIPDYYG